MLTWTDPQTGDRRTIILSKPATLRKAERVAEGIKTRHPGVRAVAFITDNDVTLAVF